MRTMRRLVLVITFLSAGFAYSGTQNKLEDPNRFIGGVITKNFASCPHMNRAGRNSNVALNRPRGNATTGVKGMGSL